MRLNPWSLMEMVLPCPCRATCPSSFPWTQEAREARSQGRRQEPGARSQGRSRRERAMAGVLAYWRRIRSSDEHSGGHVARDGADCTR